MQVYELNFYGDRLLGVKRAGDFWVPIAPICDLLNIDLNGQKQRVHRHPVLSKGGCIIHLPSQGGAQAMLCLSLNVLHLWLASVDASRIKDDDASAKVIRYQIECATALRDYFLFGRAVNPNLTATLLQSDLFGDEGAAAPVGMAAAASSDAAPLATKADLEIMLGGLREAFLQVLRQIRDGDDRKEQSLLRLEGMITGVEEMIMRLRRPLIVQPRHPFDGPPNKDWGKTQH